MSDAVPHHLPAYDPDGYELDDGEALHAASPQRFAIPAAEARRALRPGQIVKLVFRMEQPDTDVLSVERMWVQVKEAHAGWYAGVLDNDPDGNVRVKAGDRVVFEPRHVIAIYEG